jgi:hypothetical protein
MQGTGADQLSVVKKSRNGQREGGEGKEKSRPFNLIFSFDEFMDMGHDLFPSTCSGSDI